MHSPQETQLDSPIGSLSSKAIPVCEPLPMRPRTKFSRISLQPRMQRSHRMQASKSTAMLIEESSLLRPVVRCEKRGWVTFSWRASVSSSQSPECCWRAQGEGWSAINISIRVRRARWTFSDEVVTTMFGSTGRTQEAVKTRALTSTTQRRQTPTGVSFC